ncbi:MAG: hypothetical protein R6W75_05475 [Smithellaceae bacterium]
MKLFRFIFEHRLLLTILLAVAGIGLMSFYALCDTACSYLRGDIFGIDLKYVGVLFMTLLIACSLFHQADLLRMFIAAGIGVEIFLVIFQVQEQVFCPFCLAFGTIIFLMYFVNYERVDNRKNWYETIIYAFGDARLPFTENVRLPLFALMLAGYIFTCFSFSGSTIPSYLP